MIDEMTLQVLARLERGGHRLSRLADLGCGAGAPAAFLLRARPALRLDGVTLLAEQAEMARADGAARAPARAPVPRHGLHRDALSGRRVRRRDGDREQLPRAGRRQGGVRARGGAPAGAGRAAGRRRRVLEAAGQPRGLAGWAIDQVARNWAVPCFANLDEFRRALSAHGFVDVEVEEISWRLGPSVAHIPFVTARVLARYLIRRDLHIGRVRWGHVLASVLAPVVGLMRRRFGYYLISARKAG